MLSQISKIPSFNKNSFLPAILFAIAILVFYFDPTIKDKYLKMLHIAFYTLSISSILFLFYFNRSKALFSVLTLFLSYLGLNYLRARYGNGYTDSNAFHVLFILTPLNLLLFYIVPDYPFSNRQNLYFLVLLFLEISLFEKILHLEAPINFIIPLSSIGLLLFLGISVILLIHTSKNDSIINVGLFFAFLNILFAFGNNASILALTFFFPAAALTIFIALLREIYYTTFHDTLTGLFSRRSFLSDEKHFPLKYSLGIIAIDDYTNLRKVFGISAIDNLTKMITLVILENGNNMPIYRYTPDEFLIVFKGEDKNVAFKHTDQIRRSIASSEFLIKRNKPIKITVSGSVTEKKRVDSSAIETLSRARKALQKTYKFTQNVIAKA